MDAACFFDVKDVISFLRQKRAAYCFLASPCLVNSVYRYSALSYLRERVVINGTIYSAIGSTVLVNILIFSACLVAVCRLVCGRRVPLPS
jgi:hypothetical protein